MFCTFFPKMECIFSVSSCFVFCFGSDFGCFFCHFVVYFWWGVFGVVFFVFVFLGFLLLFVCFMTLMYRCPCGTIPFCNGIYKSIQ